VFPVEVLVNIAGFAAGANDYAEVAAMCATSRLMNAEIKPVLFETLFWNDSKESQLQQLLDNPNESESKLRYVRYVLSENVLRQLY
jgi:hypothetical protein